MARPKLNTVTYFPHNCNHSKTMFVIEQKFGNDGYAFWFKLLELLGSTENHFFDCRNESNWEFLQAKTHLGEDTCSELLNLLSKLNAIDRDLWDQKIIWCDNFMNNIKDVYTNRRVETPPKPSFYSGELNAVEVSTPESTQSKVNKIKVNQTKVDKSKVNKEELLIFNLFSLLGIEESKFTESFINRTRALIDLLSYDEIEKIFVKVSDMPEAKRNIAYIEAIAKKEFTDPTHSKQTQTEPHFVYKDLMR